MTVRAAGYQAAAQSYEAAKRQNALGMLSRANYLGLECSWLSSVASYKTAELEYTKAVENYEWAVKGLIVTQLIRQELAVYLRCEATVTIHG